MAILSLLLQLFLSAFHIPGLSAAQKVADEIPAGFTFICTGAGLQLVATDAGGKPSDGSKPALTLYNCPICLTHCASPATAPGETVLPEPVLSAVYSLLPVLMEAGRDHRETIRPGHGPPITL